MPFVFPTNSTSTSSKKHLGAPPAKKRKISEKFEFHFYPSATSTSISAPPVYTHYKETKKAMKTMSVWDLLRFVEAHPEFDETADRMFKRHCKAMYPNPPDELFDYTWKQTFINFWEHEKKQNEQKMEH